MKNIKPFKIGIFLVHAEWREKSVWIEHFGEAVAALQIWGGKYSTNERAFSYSVINCIERHKAHNMYDLKLPSDQDELEACQFLKDLEAAGFDTSGNTLYYITNY